MKWNLDFDKFEDDLVNKAFAHDFLVSFPKKDTYGAIKDYPKLVPLGRYVTTQLSGGVVRLNTQLTTDELKDAFSKALGIDKNEVEVAYTVPTT